MARPNNKLEAIDYVKRKLGYPYYQVQITDDQMDDVITDGLNLFKDYHYDSTENSLVMLDTTAGVAEYVLAADVYAVTDILDRSVYDQFFLRFPTRDRSPEEISFIMSVTSQSRGGAMSDMMFGMQNLNFFRDQFLPRNMWNYNFNTHKLRFVSTPSASTTVGMTYALLVEKLIDVNGTGEGSLYSNRWLLKYWTALAKIQMGSNLTKYNVITLPGGLTVNGEKFLTEGKEEKDKLEEELVNQLGDVSKLSSVYWG